MADQKRVKSSGGRPGLKGALVDLVESVSRATAPKSVTEADSRTQTQVDDMDTGRKRQNQTTDRHN